MPRLRLKGVIIKKSGDKTYKVVVVKKIRHPLYKKVIKKRSKFLVHSEKDYPVGTPVLIEETKRISKLKHFRIVKPLQKANVEI